MFNRITKLYMGLAIFILVLIIVAVIRNAEQEEVQQCSPAVGGSYCITVKK
ncbi:hypothetical protein ACIRA0001_0174 [Acinetobacter radioresistens SK82]|uniref:Uncharacterized protein n=1 Tax=Acinetobacter radioresistens SK82 TaxID=596318 RepID=A0ABM9YJT3_ACIRA|nr:hypothetical protein ACIRA0001_0174 [Acinetobacter radioresistens SK82]ENV87708.1 hypothetical protein F940_00173 [Acinetobacter radioresistens NIPH 2130]EXB78559.1 hypothetical protein J538_3207 [Acinetobacter sp. 272263]EXE54652.1 hypothetical protein J579_3153 [Acinetobacter sp. 1239920]